MVALYIGLLVATIISGRFVYEYRKDKFDISMILYFLATFAFSVAFFTLSYLVFTYLREMDTIQKIAIVSSIAFIVLGFLFFALLLTVFVAFGIKIEKMSGYFKFFLIRIVFTLLALGVFAVIVYKLWLCFIGKEYMPLSSIIVLLIVALLMLVFLYLFSQKDSHIKLTKEPQKIKKVYVKKGEVIKGEKYFLIYFLLFLILVFGSRGVIFWLDGSMWNSLVILFFTTALLIILIQKFFNLWYFKRVPLRIQSDLKKGKEFKGFIRLSINIPAKTKFKFILEKSKATQFYDDFEEKMVYSTTNLYKLETLGRVKKSKEFVDVYFKFPIKSEVTDDWKITVSAKIDGFTFSRWYSL